MQAYTFKFKENCRNNCDCHKPLDLSKISKEYLLEQLEAVEDERNKYLVILNELAEYFDIQPMLTEEQEYLLEKININIGR